VRHKIKHILKTVCVRAIPDNVLQKWGSRFLFNVHKLLFFSIKHVLTVVGNWLSQVGPKKWHNLQLRQY